MKQGLRAFLAFLLCLALLAVQSFAADVPETYSETYCVMDATTGQVLLEKDAHKRMYPASITKILTAAIALRDGNPNDEWTMSYKATHTIEPGSTHIALTDGETVKVRDLLYTMMIESANDSANGLAEYVAGDIDDFPAVMNETAQEIGAVDSHFMNANGLPDPEHYTTAYDMALITKWALTIPGFRDVFGAEEYTMPGTNIADHSEPRHFGTRNPMLVESKYYYEGTEGGKLGWTEEAQHTLVELVRRGDMELIVVVLKSSGNQYYKYQDVIALCDYCFDTFGVSTFSGALFEHDPIPVIKDGAVVGSVTLSTDDISVNHPATIAKSDIICMADVPEFYSADAPITPTAVFTDRAGAVIAEVPIAYTYEKTASETPEAEPAAPEKPERAGGSLLLRILRWILTALLILFVLFVIFVFSVRWYNMRRRRKRREARQAQLRARQQRRNPPRQ